MSKNQNNAPQTKPAPQAPAQLNDIQLDQVQGGYLKIKMKDAIISSYSVSG